MSVIIRLQGLSWSASAMNIRHFFSGLNIPAGGVHIIGGDGGDAFIAFSSDDDARMAMKKNMCSLNDQPIQLFLSSKAEMQSVIDAARSGAPASSSSAAPSASQPNATMAGGMTPHIQQQAQFNQQPQHQQSGFPQNMPMGGGMAVQGKPGIHQGGGDFSAMQQQQWQDEYPIKPSGRDDGGAGMKITDAMDARFKAQYGNPVMGQQQQYGMGGRFPESGSYQFPDGRPQDSIMGNRGFSQQGMDTQAALGGQMTQPGGHMSQHGMMGDAMNQRQMGGMNQPGPTGNFNQQSGQMGQQGPPGQRGLMDQQAQINHQRSMGQQGPMGEHMNQQQFFNQYQMGGPSGDQLRTFQRENMMGRPGFNNQNFGPDKGTLDFDKTQGPSGRPGAENNKSLDAPGISTPTSQAGGRGNFMESRMGGNTPMEGLGKDNRGAMPSARDSQMSNRMQGDFFGNRNIEGVQMGGQDADRQLHQGNRPAFSGMSSMYRGSQREIEAAKRFGNDPEDEMPSTSYPPEEPFMDAEVESRDKFSSSSRQNPDNISQMPPGSRRFPPDDQTPTEDSVADQHRFSRFNRFDSMESNLGRRFPGNDRMGNLGPNLSRFPPPGGRFPPDDMPGGSGFPPSQPENRFPPRDARFRDREELLQGDQFERGFNKNIETRQGGPSEERGPLNRFPGERDTDRKPGIPTTETREPGRRVSRWDTPKEEIGAPLAPPISIAASQGVMPPTNIKGLGEDSNLIEGKPMPPLRPKGIAGVRPNESLEANKPEVPEAEERAGSQGRAVSEGRRSMEPKPLGFDEARGYEGRGPGFDNRGLDFPAGREPGFDGRGGFQRREMGFEVAGSEFDDSGFERRRLGFDGRDPSYVGRGRGSEGRGPGFEGRDSNFDGRRPGFEGRGPNFEGRGPGIEGRGPDFEGRRPGFEGRDSSFEGRRPGFEGRGTHFEGRRPGFEGRGPEFEGREPGFEDREAGLEGRGSDFQERRHGFEGRDPAFERRVAEFERGRGFEGRGPRFEGRPPHFEGRETGYDEREFEGRGPRFEGRSHGFEGRGLELDNREPEFEGRGPGFPERGMAYAGRGSRFEGRGRPSEEMEFSMEGRGRGFVGRRPGFGRGDMPEFEHRDRLGFDGRGRPGFERGGRFGFEARPGFDEEDKHSGPLGEREPRFTGRGSEFEGRAPGFEDMDIDIRTDESEIDIPEPGLDRMREPGYGRGGPGIRGRGGGRGSHGIDMISRQHRMPGEPFEYGSEGMEDTDSRVHGRGAPLHDNLSRGRGDPFARGRGGPPGPFGRGRGLDTERLDDPGLLDVDARRVPRPPEEKSKGLLGDAPISKDMPKGDANKKPEDDDKSQGFRRSDSASRRDADMRSSRRSPDRERSDRERERRDDFRDRGRDDRRSDDRNRYRYGRDRYRRSRSRDRSRDKDRDRSPRSRAEGREKSICLKNIPINANYKEVRRFLQPLDIPFDGLKILNDEKGNRVGIAYVQLRRPEDAQRALRRNGERIGSNSVRVTSCSDDEFSKAVDSFVPDKKDAPSGDTSGVATAPNPIKGKPVNSSETRHIVQLKNLPQTITKRDIIDFFKDIVIHNNGEAAYIEFDASGVATGMGYVELKSDIDYKKSLTKDGFKIGTNSIRVFPGKAEEADILKSKQLEMLQRAALRNVAGTRMQTPPNQTIPSRPGLPVALPPLQPLIQPRATNPALVRMPAPQPNQIKPMFPGAVEKAPSPQKQQQSPTKAPPLDSNQSSLDTVCVHIQGLPLLATPQDIRQFFGESQIAQRGINIAHDSRGKPLGEGFVEFRGRADFEKAVKKDKTSMGRHIVAVKPIGKKDMLNRLGLSRQPGQQDQSSSNKAKESHSEQNTGPSSQPGPPTSQANNSSNTPQQQQPTKAPTPAESPQSQNGAPPRQQQPISRPKPLMAGVPMGKPPGMPVVMGPGAPNKSIPPGVLNQNWFYVRCQNFPPDISITEILHFFQGFRPIGDSIRLHYSSDGKPTGNAVVGFGSPEEAQRALGSLNMKNCRHNVISLHPA